MLNMLLNTEHRQGLLCLTSHQLVVAKPMGWPAATVLNVLMSACTGYLTVCWQPWLSGVYLNCLIWFSSTGKHTDTWECCEVSDGPDWNSLHGTLIYAKDFTLFVGLLTSAAASTKLVDILPLFLHPAQLDCYCTAPVVEITDPGHPDKPWLLTEVLSYHEGEGDECWNTTHGPARWWGKKWQASALLHMIGHEVLEALWAFQPGGITQS